MLACILREMTGQPKANRVDRTSLLVGVGMTTLLVLGVATIFGDTIAAAFSPAPSPAPSQAATPQGSALTAAASGAATVPGADGGGGKS